MWSDICGGGLVRERMAPPNKGVKLTKPARLNRIADLVSSCIIRPHASSRVRQVGKKAGREVRLKHPAGDRLPGGNRNGATRAIAGRLDYDQSARLAAAASSCASNICSSLSLGQPSMLACRGGLLSGTTLNPCASTILTKTVPQP